MQPILVIASKASQFMDLLAEALPEERFVVIDGPGQAARALDGLAPEIAFGVHGRVIPKAEYHHVRDLPSLRYFHVGGSGYEWLGDWDPGRLQVTNCVGVLAPYLADTAMGALLALNNGLLRYRALQGERRWAPADFQPLEGRLLAIVGAGAIGRAFAARAKTFGLQTVGLSRDGAPRAPLDSMRPLSELDDVLAEADIVSCHLRLTPETRQIFDARRFALMKPGALFLNSARGGHVVEPALAEALRSGHLAGAWLDVFETEPLPAESPLWGIETLFVTPHAADQITGWNRRFAALFAENVVHFRAGRPLVNLVA
ncbi:MAG: D-2-hydroxyacid dehydrogenase [Pseudomonadota bacterium]